MIAYMHNVKKSLKNDTNFFTKQKWESDIEKKLTANGINIYILLHTKHTIRTSCIAKATQYSVKSYVRKQSKKAYIRTRGSLC